MGIDNKIGDETKSIPVKEEAKAAIESYFQEATRNLGLVGVAKFKGYFNEDSNARAMTGITNVSFNEKFIGMLDDERERIMFHEAQHVQNRAVMPESEHPEHLFVLHPTFLPIYERMKAHYNRHKAQGYPFAKSFPDLPKTLDDVIDPHDTYPKYDEVLALLRGYEIYLKQLAQGKQTSIQPYEFIEAFKSEDLKLLDSQHRASLAQEVLDANPSLQGEMFREVEMDWTQ